MKTTTEDEHELCISCGFCCDKTLFDAAAISKDEIAYGFFAEKEVEMNGKRYFKLPCIHFDCKCTIYDKAKPNICSAFKCRLLKRMINEKVEKTEAMSIVELAKKSRNEIIEEFTKLTGKTFPFRDIFNWVNTHDDFDDDPEKRKLKFKVHLLDIQLGQEFKSKKEFEDFYEMMDQ